MATEQPAKKGLSANWAVTEVDHLFTTLGRYTKFVIYSKWFLLLFAFGLLTTLIALPLLSHDRSGIRVSFVDAGSLKGKQAASPVMNNPEYRGVGQKGEQFKVNGSKATQVTPTLIRIDHVESQMLGQDGSWRSLTANSADYHQDTKMILLQGDVTLLDNRDYTFTTQEATVDTYTMDVTGTVLITCVGPMGNLLASAFEIRDSGKHLIFTSTASQQVHVHIDRNQHR